MRVNKGNINNKIDYNDYNKLNDLLNIQLENWEKNPFIEAFLFLNYYMKNILLFIFISISFLQDFDELYFGTDDALDIITWNIEWFPKNGEITVNYVTQIIDALDIDVLAIQEIDDVSSFNQVINGLENYEGYLESSWFAGLAYIYNTQTVEINNIYEIYTTSPYWSPFPRSPMVMDMNFMGENYIIINNHFKCCGDGNLNLNDDG